MATVQRHSCKSGVEEKLEYTIDDLLWNDPESYARNSGKVSKGFIDCSQKRLPSPFVVGTKVIVYCDTKHSEGDICDSPVEFSDDRLKQVQSWIADLQQREGDPVLLQVHEHLHDSIELSPDHPTLFLGEVTWIEKLTGPRVCKICVLPGMRLAVTRVLWGYANDARDNLPSNEHPRDDHLKHDGRGNGHQEENRFEIESSCPHGDCSNISVGARVIVWCGAISPGYPGPERSCPFVTTAYTDENLRRVDQWVNEARSNQPGLILREIQKSLDHHTDPAFQPKVYRGLVQWTGRDDNGSPVVQLFEPPSQALGSGNSPERNPPKISILFRLFYPQARPLPVQIGKPIITFCYQRNDTCYAGTEATGIITDSDETFRDIEKMIEEKNISSR